MPHPTRKKLIEVALPLEAINEASAREKSIRHGHPSTLHLWWARRPLAAARAVLFASLVDDPGDPELTEGAAPPPPEYIAACRALPRGKNAANRDTPRMRLFDFIETLVQWESTTDERTLEIARQLIRLSTGGNPPPLLDPFAGGGSIPLEAQRLGLEAHASDLNPVAVMINKALIEIPPLFAGKPPVNPRDRGGMRQGMSWQGAQGLAADVRYYGEWMRDRAWERIGSLYPLGPNGETVIAWLWARTVRCPNPACGAQMPLVRSFDLSKKKGKETRVEPIIDRIARRVTFTVKSGGGKAPEGTVERSGARCIVCGTPVPFKHIRAEGRAGRMGAQLMAIVTEGERGRNYYAPDENHVHIAEQAQPTWRPDHPLPHNPRDFKTPNYGMTTFADLFTPRQLVALTTFSDLVGEAREVIRQDAIAAGLPDDGVPLREGGTGARAYAEAVSVYLAFAVSRFANRSATICVWNTQGEKIEQVFARQAIPMNWDYPEANPFSESTGNWLGNMDWIGEVLEALLPAITKGFAVNRDATHPNGLAQIMVSTDPPYYDNIGYADLSDFFYIWMRQGIQEVYPEIFATLLTPKVSELVATPYRFGNDATTAERHFEQGLQRAFRIIREVMLPDYPLTVYYAFKQQEVVGKEASSTGWETMLEGLIGAGYLVNGTWPMRTERPTGVKKSINALASSIVLVCRPRPEDAPTVTRREFLAALRRELPPALQALQTGNIAPVDLAQAAIGPGMAVYSRYRRVLEANGEPLTVRAALQIINAELDAYLAEAEGGADTDTRFAVAWFEQHGFGEGKFGEADVLARAKNTSVDGLVQAGIVEARGGRVRLKEPHELDPGWDPTADKRPTVWEATHHLLQELDVHGEQGAAALLLKMGSDLAADARQLAYRLYNICERKGWAKLAQDYNALVIQWPGVAEQAARFREQRTTGGVQMDLFGDL